MSAREPVAVESCPGRLLLRLQQTVARLTRSGIAKLVGGQGRECLNVEVGRYNCAIRFNRSMWNLVESSANGVESGYGRV